MAGTLDVTLSDTLITVDGWTPDLNRLGEYVMKIRKTPDEMKAEKAARANGSYSGKVDPIRRERRTCISHDPKTAGRVYFLPGLWPRIQSELKSMGRQFRIVADDRDPAIRPELDWSAFDGVEFREKQDVAIATIAASDCGIIDCATAWGKSFCISLICKAFPTLNIVITTSSTQVVKTLYEYLCKTVPGQVGMLCGGKDTTFGKRIVVSTLKSLPNIPAEKVQMVLVDECRWHGTR